MSYNFNDIGTYNYNYGKYKHNFQNYSTMFEFKYQMQHQKNHGEQHWYQAGIVLNAFPDIAFE